MAFRPRVRGMFLGLALVGATGILPSLAQDPSEKSEAPSKASRRVPAYFSKVGLTPEQREKIYGIRAKHADKIESLKKQIEDEQAKELSECEAILQDSQKKLLEEFRASGKASKSKTPAGEKAKADMKKSD